MSPGSVNNPLDWMDGSALTILLLQVEKEPGWSIDLFHTLEPLQPTVSFYLRENLTLGTSCLSQVLKF